MDDKAVSDDVSIKDLGITFQDTFKFDKHIGNICATANSRLGVIRGTFHINEREKDF